MITSTNELRVEKRDGAVLHLTLTRAKRANALSESLVETLLAAIDDAEREQIQLVVFIGEGKNFCSGFDLGDLAPQNDADLVYKLLRIERLLQRVAYAPFMTLALAQGRVIGAGADLFCACSERIASPGASFRMPGWRFGVALGTRRLAARLGVAAARAVLLEGRTLHAVEAHEMSFATAIVPEADWPEIVRQAAQRSAILDWQSNRSLLHLTMEDTRAADMAALVETSTRPGLKERILQYREAEKRSLNAASV